MPILRASAFWGFRLASARPFTLFCSVSGACSNRAGPPSFGTRPATHDRKLETHSVITKATKSVAKSNRSRKPSGYA